MKRHYRTYVVADQVQGEVESELLGREAVRRLLREEVDHVLNGVGSDDVAVI